MLKFKFIKRSQHIILQILNSLRGLNTVYYKGFFRQTVASTVGK